MLIRLPRGRYSPFCSPEVIIMEAIATPYIIPVISIFYINLSHFDDISINEYIITESQSSQFFFSFANF
jgi:hypothetical protein